MTQSTHLQPAASNPERSFETETAPGKLLIIGATRGTGREVMHQALAAGGTVTALARDPARIDTRHEHLTVVRGDVLDLATVTQAMAGQDAVISTIGVTGRAPTTLYSDGMRTILQAMGATGVRRLVAVSAAPLRVDGNDTLPTRLLIKPLLLALLRPVYTDMARMEALIQASDLDWTIVRPPRLLDKQATHRYRTAINRNVRRGNMIGRADLAEAIITLLGDPTTFRAAVAIGY